MSNVVAIPGYEGEIRAPGEPNPDVVRVLERYLERAKAGDIVAVAIAGVRHDGANTSIWASDGGLTNALISSVAMLDHRVLAVSMDRMQTSTGSDPWGPDAA